MKGKAMARFMELRGRRVLAAAGFYWHSVEGRFYLSLPYQLRLNPSGGEIDEMLRASRGTGVRFPSGVWPGSPGGLYVCRNKDYGIGTLHRTCRRGVLRALEVCEIRPVEAEQLLVEGLQLNRETMRRQSRFDAEFGKPGLWKRFVAAVAAVPALEAIGAFRRGRLVSYAIVCREDGWLHVLHRMSLDSERTRYTNHALDFQITRQVAADPALEAVSLGWVSLVSLPDLHRYKLHLGYRLEPHREVIRLHPALSSVLASRPVARAVGWWRRLRPTDQRAEKLARILSGARLSRGGEKESRCCPAGGELI